MLEPDRAAASPLHGRVAFVLASPESGAERLMRALGTLPGVARAPAPTHVFTQGVATVLDLWMYRGIDIGLHQGLEHFLDEQDFLSALRAMVDEVLVKAGSGGKRIVEYSYGHIRLIETIATLYPDADIIHLVRDGRVVVSRLCGPLYGWSAPDACLSWQVDQESVVASEHSPRLQSVRFEDLEADPGAVLHRLTERLGLTASDDAIDAAAEVIGGRDRVPAPKVNGAPAAMAEVLVPETLRKFGYHVGPATRTHRRLRAELMLERVRDSVRERL